MSRPQRADRRLHQRDRRRAERRRRGATAQRRAERRRRLYRLLRWAVPAAVAVGVVVAVALVVRDALRPGPRQLATVHPVRTYAIDYRTEFTNVVNQEHRVVDRPFHSLSTTTRDGALKSGSLTNDQGLWFFQEDDGKWHLIEPGTHATSDDPDPAPALNLALRHSQAKVLGTTTIAGRRCTSVRTGNPLGKPLKAPTTANHVDVCVDANGLMLRYEWTLDGKVAQTMLATAVDVSPAITPATFTPAPVSDDPAPVTANPLSEDARSRLNPRFRPLRDMRYVAGWARVEQQGPTPRITQTELYVLGDFDLVTLRYGPESPAPAGTTVGLKGGRKGYLTVALDSSRLNVPLTRGSVLISGTDADVLVRVARALVFG